MVECIFKDEGESLVCHQLDQGICCRRRYAFFMQLCWVSSNGYKTHILSPSSNPKCDKIFLPLKFFTYKAILHKTGATAPCIPLETSTSCVTLMGWCSFHHILDLASSAQSWKWILLLLLLVLLWILTNSIAPQSYCLDRLFPQAGKWNKWICHKTTFKFSKQIQRLLTSRTV